MAQTNKGRKFYIACTAPNGTTPDPQNSDLDQAGFDALDWTEVKGVGSIGTSGTSTNIVSYNTLADAVVQKGKGLSNAGDPAIECARKGSDNGQIAMRAAAQSHNNFAFKIEDDDSGGTNGTTYYNRGLVTGPARNNGRNEDFVLETFTLGLNQVEIVKEAA